MSDPFHTIFAMGGAKYPLMQLADGSSCLSIAQDAFDKALLEAWKQGMSDAAKIVRSRLQHAGLDVADTFHAIIQARDERKEP